MLRWLEPVSFVTGATPSVRRAWASLGIRNVGELLETLPRRYDDFSHIVSIKQTQTGDVVTVRGLVTKCAEIPSFRKRFKMMRATIKDASGYMSATFFNQPWLLQELTVGREILFSGKVTVHPTFGRSMSNPLWEPAGSETVAAGKLAPVYGLSEALTQKVYRRLIQYTLEHVEVPVDPIDEATRVRLKLPTYHEALRFAHQPLSLAEADRGRQRLAFDELLSYRLALAQSQSTADQAGAPAIPFDEVFAKRFVSSLPFPLTADQKRAVWSALQNMTDPRPMRRLLQGDVGSGKTIVAAFLCAHVQRAGGSSVMLAPTDLLARQHAATFRRVFAPHRIPLMIVTRLEKRFYFDQEERELSNEEMMTLVEGGNVVLVGTHALLEAKRLPVDLSLAIVDEQHRFGVEQREALLASRTDGRVAHFLSMTATPIPRSLALTLYGDLDVSVLREKPKGRVPILSFVCPGESRERAYQAIRDAVSRGERAFVVCPLIDPSDVLGAKSATDEWTRLARGPLQGLRLGLLHGKLKPIEKDQTMQDFLNGSLDVLVATSVIEVGIDVPQATVIAIEGAERFGLAQLHQLRGRVGRSHLASHCFLLTDAEGESLERLHLVERISDGFQLAEEDLRLRGGGNLMGTAQSGHDAFRAARASDVELMEAAREEAERMLKEDVTLGRFPAWKERVERLRNTAHLE